MYIAYASGDGQKGTVFPFEGNGFALNHLADVFEAAIERIVTSAAQGMDFSSSALSEAEGKHFAFTTPPCPDAQYYRQEAQQPVSSVSSVATETGPRTKASVAQFTDEIKMPKSENAVAPNASTQWTQRI